MTTKRGQPTKKYGDPKVYEKKLKSVMTRIGVEKYNYDYGLRGGWVELWLGGKAHRFEQTVERSQTLKSKDRLNFGSDCFIQVVRTIEDLARAGERGIFTIRDIFDNLPRLTSGAVIPEFFTVLGFCYIPTSKDDVTAKFRELVKEKHPDHGGSRAEYDRLIEAKTLALAYFDREA